MTNRVLDVRPDDLSAATAALQQLALALFEELFDGVPGLTAERWFAAPDARVLDRLPFSRLGWRRKALHSEPKSGRLSSQDRPRGHGRGWHDATHG